MNIILVLSVMSIEITYFSVLRLLLNAKLDGSNYKYPSGDHISLPVTASKDCVFLEGLSGTLVAHECSDSTYYACKCNLFLIFYKLTKYQFFIKKDFECPGQPRKTYADFKYKEGHKYLQKATYTCKTGFEASNHSKELTFTCGDRKGKEDWVADDLDDCRDVNCSNPQTLENGRAEYNSTLYSTKAIYICDNYFTLIGSDSTICQDNATWSNLPECKSMNYFQQNY